MRLAAEPAALVLETGHAFFGFAFGSPERGAGEVVFNTSMTGYQEISTDASYRGQIVTLTYPLIDNYGVNADDMESRQPWIAGLAVRELSPTHSNWRMRGGMHEFLATRGIPGIEGIDTRALTRIVRTQGIRRGILDRAPKALVQDVEAYRWMAGTWPGTASWIAQLIAESSKLPAYDVQRYVAEVTTPTPYVAEGSGWSPWPQPRVRAWNPRIVLLDVGVKQNIVRSLAERGCDVHVLPFDATTSEVSALAPDGVVVCNGPGDPVQAGATVETVQHLIGQQPLMGICLGHQILGLAISAKTSRLPFGHRGANHPVRDLATGRAHITSQNHGFQVDASTIPADSGFKVSHVHLNDGSVEGLAHESLPIFSIQYHPEASPGPQDSQYLFDRFLDLVDRDAGKQATS